MEESPEAFWDRMTANMEELLRHMPTFDYGVWAKDPWPAFLNAPISADPQDLPRLEGLRAEFRNDHINVFVGAFTRVMRERR